MSSSSWTEEESDALVAIWAEWARGCLASGHALTPKYKDLQTSLGKRGFERTSTQVKSKMSHLLTKFREAKLENETFGEGTATSPYYDIFSSILGESQARDSLPLVIVVNLMQQQWPYHQTIDEQTGVYPRQKEETRIHISREAQTMWRSIRDSYAKRRRLGKLGTGGWELDSQLSFIDPFLSSKPGCLPSGPRRLPSQVFRSTVVPTVVETETNQINFQLTSSPNVQLTTNAEGELTFTSPTTQTANTSWGAPLDVEGEVVIPSSADGGDGQPPEPHTSGGGNTPPSGSWKDEGGDLARRIQNAQLRKVELEMQCLEKEHLVKLECMQTEHDIKVKCKKEEHEANMEILVLKKSILLKELGKLQ